MNPQSKKALEVIKNQLQLAKEELKRLAAAELESPATMQVDQHERDLIGIEVEPADELDSACAALDECMGYIVNAINC